MSLGSRQCAFANVLYHYRQISCLLSGSTLAPGSTHHMPYQLCIVLKFYYSLFLSQTKPAECDYARMQLIRCHILILDQSKVVKLELISKSRHPLFQLVIFVCWSHILTSAYIISKDLKFSQLPSPWGWTWPSTGPLQDASQQDNLSVISVKKYLQITTNLCVI